MTADTVSAPAAVPASAPSTAATTTAPKPPGRLGSLDAYRGLIMLFMASAGLGLPQIAKLFPDSKLWAALAYNTSHEAWIGGGAWDMIQPAFMFMVGVAMPFSLGRRTMQGQSFGWLFFHAIWRSLVLVALAVFLASKGAKQTSFTFPNVLGQIGLGYTFLFLLAGRGWKVQLGAMAGIAVAVWAAFALHPLPSADFDYTKVGVKADELKDCVLPGFFAHWNKNTNFAASFDQWFLNLFPTANGAGYNAGGYTTLNFVPSLITMILGLMVGERLRRDDSQRAKLLWMAKIGVLCLALGLIAGWTVCPIIKRIWTPSWAFFSGGIVVWMLAALYWVIDMRGWKAWSFPLVVVGMNSIAIYLMDQLLPGWFVEQLRIHFGRDLFKGDYGILWQRLSVLLILWLICFWMYRRKIFLKI